MSDGVKWKVLAGLVLLWVIFLTQRLMTDPEVQRVPLKYTSGQTAVALNERSSSRPMLKGTTLLAKSTRIQGKPSKNIFAPLEFPKPKRKKVKKVVKVAPPPPPPPAPVVPRGPSPEELAAAQARKQMAQYRFMGYVAEGGEPRAFLVKGRQIYILRAGETVEQTIMVASIDPKSVTLRETRTNLAATLPLTKSATGLLAIQPADTP